MGKTTLVMKVADYVRKRGVRVWGFITMEVREGGSRIGFKIIDLTSGREAWLAHISMFKGGPKVGRYNVNLKAMEEIAIPLLKNVPNGVLFVIDEIGKMELLHPEFLKTLDEVVPRVHLLGTIFQAYRTNQNVKSFVERHGFKIFELTIYNRDRAFDEVLKEVLRELGLA